MSDSQQRSSVLSGTYHKPEGFRWLTLKRIKYRDPRGRERLWESAERLNRHGGVDGVAIITQVISKDKPMQIILESQFRPSQGSYVIEFPAGLVDEGESVEQAAVRELKEETGYSGEVVDVTMICYNDPGMTNSNMQAVTIRVDAASAANASVQPQLEDGEFIDVFLLPYSNLYQELRALQQSKGWDIDARLLLYALGLEQAAAVFGVPNRHPV